MPSFSIALQRKQANEKTNQDRAEQRERKTQEEYAHTDTLPRKPKTVSYTNFNLL